MSRNLRQTYDQWIDAVSHAKGDPEPVLKLYAQGATLLPTMAQGVLTERDDLKTYFIHFTNQDFTHIETYDFQTQMIGDLAINTGVYIFHGELAGQGKSVAARFSFTYENIDGQWLIVNHHSSQEPALSLEEYSNQ